MKIKYKRISNYIWYREYRIFISTGILHNQFIGWICKYNKTDRKFNAFSSELRITPTDYNNYFKTLREAKKFIKKQAEIYFTSGEKGNE